MECKSEGESEHKNPVAVVQFKLREAETRFRRWLEKQPFPVAAAFSSATGAAIGAAGGALIEAACSLVSRQPPALAISARNYAASIGVQIGTHHVMIRLRGKQDVHSSMVEGFCAGVSYSLLSGVGLISGVGLCGPNQHAAANALSMGLFTALTCVGMHQWLEKSSKPPEEHS